MVTTLGKLLVNNAIPEDMRDPDRVFDKKQATAFFQDLAVKHPDQYVAVLRKLSDISRVAATEQGEGASLRLRDLQLPPRTKEYRKQLRIRIQSIAEDPKLTTEQKQDQIVNTMHKAIPIIEKTLFGELEGRDNGYAESVKRGWRGNPLQVMQLMFGDMLVADHRDRPVPIPGLHGYGEGVTPSEYWAGSYGSRKGYASVQFATAKTGFLGKQMSQMAQRVQITGDDCGANRVGILVDGDDSENVGSVLARTEGGVPAGTVITKTNLPKLQGKKVLVRSLITCQQPEGVCKMCAGKRDQGSFPPKGAYIGIDAARIVSEPMTQELALSVKHTGGISKQRTEDISGFEEINQFVQVPKNFRGGAVLAPKDGVIQQIAKAPQGGHYIHVGDQQVYVPVDRELQVSRGQVMEAGDVLTDGTPNPAEIAKHKGLGEGRVYFLGRFQQMLKENGVPTHRRNIEALARSFFDRIQVTNPEGVMGHRIGDTVLYSDLQRDYEPRKGSVESLPKRSLGRYLEQPVLHYTIGTKVTPRVVKTLEEQGISKVLVHDQDPGFEPEVMRVMDIPASDPDWKVRMAGFGLQKSFLDAARMGSKSPRKTTSPVSAVMDPSRL